MKNNLAAQIVTDNKIRQSTQQYHDTLYKSKKIFEKGSWLEKPEEEILNIGRKLLDRKNVKILDLGCGVGRNAIPLVQLLRENNPKIVCVDYLKSAISRLRTYAKKYSVTKFIYPLLCSVEDYKIQENTFDYRGYPLNTPYA